MLRLGEDTKLHYEEKGSPPRRREGSPRKRGSPRQGYVHLGEPEDKIGGLSGPPRQTTSPR